MRPATSRSCAAWADSVGDGPANAPAATMVRVDSMVSCSCRWYARSSARCAASARMSCPACRLAAMATSARRPLRRSSPTRTAVTAAWTTRNQASAGCGTVVTYAAPTTVRAASPATGRRASSEM